MGVEVPEVVQVEVSREVIKPIITQVDKMVPKVSFKATEVVSQVDLPLVEEVVKEVPVTHVAELKREVPKYQVEGRDVKVMRTQTEVITKIEEVPQRLVHERLMEVPEVRSVELRKEVPNPVTREVVKRVPKVTEIIARPVITQVPKPLVQEVAREVPKTINVEVMTQRASDLMQRRIVQTNSLAMRHVRAEEVVVSTAESREVEVFEAPVTTTRLLPV